MAQLHLIISEFVMKAKTKVDLSLNTQIGCKKQCIIIRGNAKSSISAKKALIFVRLVIDTKSCDFTIVLATILLKISLIDGPINTATVGKQPLPSPSFLKKILTRG